MNPDRPLRAVAWTCAVALMVLGCLPAAGVAAAASAYVPPPPYFSIQLATAADREQALKQMERWAGEQDVRAEERRSGWQIRVGAWTRREQAEQALEGFRQRGVTSRVLTMQSSVPWLLPDGTTRPLAPPRSRAPAPTVAAAAPVAVPMPPPPPKPAAVEFSAAYRGLAQQYDTETRRLLRTDGPVRRDGFLYAMDVAPLLLYAAERGDQTLYLQLLPHAQKLVLGPSQGTFTQGFVVWRVKEGVPLEVSGATEAGWMARALWAGAAAFNRADDRALALKILDGYAQHAFEQGGLWYVRKYYAFQSNVFANLSVLGNYQPDFMTAAEREAGATAWRGMAERAYALLERAVGPTRLLYPLIVPEIGATYPGQNVDLFAPNGLTALEDSCDAADAAVRGRPQLARGVLKFAGARGHRSGSGRLYAYYDASEGDPRGEQALSTTGYACLGHLAAMLGDSGAWEALEPRLRADMATPPTLALSSDSPLYPAGPLLLTALAAGAFSQ